MATWDAEKLLIRMREVIEDSLGTLRTTSTSQFTGDLVPGLGVNEESRRALLNTQGKSVPVETRVLSVRRSAASPPVIGNLALYDVDLEVRAVYPVTTAETLTDSRRDQVSGLAIKHADELAQALGYPGNLTQTAAAQSTGLVSGLLAYVDSSYAWSGDAGKGGVLTARHRFRGIAKSVPAVS